MMDYVILPLAILTALVTGYGYGYTEAMESVQYVEVMTTEACAEQWYQWEPEGVNVL